MMPTFASAGVRVGAGKQEVSYNSEGAQEQNDPLVQTNRMT